MSATIQENAIIDSTIDNTVIGGVTPAAATFTDVVISNSLAATNMDNTLIGQLAPASGAFTDLNSLNLTLTGPLDMNGTESNSAIMVWGTHQTIVNGIYYSNPYYLRTSWEAGALPKETQTAHQLINGFNTFIIDPDASMPLMTFIFPNGGYEGYAFELIVTKSTESLNFRSIFPIYGKSISTGVPIGDDSNQSIYSLGSTTDYYCAKFRIVSILPHDDIVDETFAWYQVS